MPSVKLTETMIAKARLGPQQKQLTLWDAKTTGLGLRILPGGSKVFWFQYRQQPGGRGAASRMMRIGPWPATALKTARKIAEGYVGEVAKGKDPAADKQEERRRSGATLHNLLADNGRYANSLKRRHIVRFKPIMSRLRRGLAGLMNKDVKDVTRQDLVAAIADIEDKGLPGAAAELRKCARTFCEWCVARGLAPTNAMAGYRQPKATRAERLASEAQKGRALDEDEIIRLWNACDGRGVFGHLVRLLLLTGTRRSEIAHLKRDHILSDRLVLPATHTKTGEKHEVPLTGLMRTVIAASPKTTSPVVFAAPTTGRAFTGWTKPLNGLRRAAGVKFTPHDLRRTCRTLMSRLGVDSDIAELAIGHKRKGLERLYNFDEAWQLRCDAFAKVSDHVARLLDHAAKEDKVVAIPART